jgi:hypothetical protein
MAQHARWKSRTSNNTMLVVECDGPVDPERLRRALEHFVDRCPWPASRLRRPFPWGKLHWVAGAVSRASRLVDHRTTETTEALHRLLEAELNDAIEPGREPPVRFIVLDAGPGRGNVAMTWFHPFVDPRGGQNLLAHLAALDSNEERPLSLDQAPNGPEPTPRRTLRERGQLARRSLEYMRTLAPVPPVSPGAGVVSPGRVRFRQATFVERDPDAAPGRLKHAISWRLAVVGRAMAELWRKRGLPDVPFLLPISVDLRPVGDTAPTFGNHLAFHFARFRPSETSDVPALASVLRRQMADAVRDGQIEANVEAMEFLQYRPLSRMLRALPWTIGGEVFSFNCADIGDFPPRLDRFLGRRVLNAYHVPCVLPRPGIGVFFNRCAGRNNIVVSWVDGAVAADEAARVVDVVAEQMEWIAQS